MVNFKVGYMKYLLTLLLVLFSANVFAGSYCDTAHKAGLEKERRMLVINNKGEYQLLLNKGECNENENCVVEEIVDFCGYIYQYIDRDNDTNCDFVLEWQPIIDPTYGVFYTLASFKRGCVLI